MNKDDVSFDKLSSGGNIINFVVRFFDELVKKMQNNILVFLGRNKVQNLVESAGFDGFVG